VADLAGHAVRNRAPGSSLYPVIDRGEQSGKAWPPKEKAAIQDRCHIMLFD
jgi:hypothetical protein